MDVSPALTDEQEKVINTMVPYYGETPSDVVQFIILNFLHENGSKILDYNTVSEMVERNDLQKRGCPLCQ